MPVRKVEVERQSYNIKTIRVGVWALKSSIGQLDWPRSRVLPVVRHIAELEEVINRNMGAAGLMLFLGFDHGAVVRKETGLRNRRS